MDEAVRSPRARYREQVREEIKTRAWGQVASTGASALSLNAIAKQMGISGPALYRYFRGRDELITELVLDAYGDLVDVCAGAAAAQRAPTARLAAVAAALRRWALAAPHRYLLIYGTPVPGYAAPPEATAIAARLMTVLLDAFAEEEAEAAAGPTKAPAGAGSQEPAEARADAGSQQPADAGTDAREPADAGTDAREPAVPGEHADPEPDTVLDDHLRAHRRWAADHPASASALRAALTFWTRLHGVLSLEVAGHFTGMGFDAALLYAAETRAAITATTR